MEPGNEQRCGLVAVADGGGNAAHVVPTLDEACGVDTVGENRSPQRSKSPKMRSV